MKVWWIAIVSITLSIAAQFTLKVAMSSARMRHILAKSNATEILVRVLADKRVLAGFALYGIGALLWLAVLSKWDVSKAYPMVGLGFAFTAVFGIAVGESFTVARGIGIALISIGVWIVART